MLERPDRIRLGVSWVVLLGAIVVLATVLPGHLPLKDWLFPRYVGYFAGSTFCIGASLGFGLALLRKGIGLRGDLAEQIICSLGAGLFLFGFGWTLLGFLHWMNPVTFFLWPSLGWGLGAWVLLPHAKGLKRLRRLSRARSVPLSGLEYAIFAFGVCAILLVYAPIMTPQNIAFDARWYHLPMAERYALLGGIDRYPEGWFLAGYPHFVSLVDSWVFSVPFGRLFDRVEFAAHLEFCVFLATLASIPVLVRRVLPRPVPLALVRLSWCALFLFPELYIYDSNLGGGADHWAAFWGIPLCLATLRAFERLNLKACILLSIFVAAVLSTKYTAASLLIGPGLLMVGRILYLGYSAARGSESWKVVLQGPGALSVLVLILWSPHWLKNWIWYKNPLFPLLGNVFPSDPWTKETIGRMGSMLNGPWRPAPGMEGALETVSQLYRFAFFPSDWATFHRDWPMIGFVFTLTVPILFLMRSWRLIFVCVAAHLGVIYWYATFHQDRYLQALIPWMATCVATAAIWLWQSGWIARVLVSVLLVIQLAWGSDAPFFGSHAMARQPLQATIDLLAGGFTGRGEDRLVAYREWEEAGATLPDNALVLRHELQVHLGLGAPTVGDWFQSGISWGTISTMQGMDKRLRSYGISHAMWLDKKSLAFDSLAADINFFYYADKYLENAQMFGPYKLGSMPKAAPHHDELMVLYLGCDGSYQPGLYKLTDLNVMPHHGKRFYPSDFPAPRIPAPKVSKAKKLVSDADIVVHNPKCMNLGRALHGANLLFRRGEDQIMVIPQDAEQSE